MPDIKKIEAALALCNDESKTLGLTFSSHKVTPGQYISKSEAKSPSFLHLLAAQLTSTSTNLILCIDLDPPLFFGPALHWLQPGLRIKPDTDNLLATVTTPSLVDYAGPEPPPMSKPHRYVFLLYKQPEGLDVGKGGKKVGVWPRMRWDFGKFGREFELGEVVAGSWILSN